MRRPITLTRLFLICSLGLLVAGCSLLPRGHWHDMNVIASSEYCGTPSEASNVEYFATPSEFATWINERNLDAFDANMAADHGVIVAEMGQRATAGYDIRLLPDDTTLENQTLTIAMEWTAPGLNAKVSQALNSRCVVFDPPAGDYDRVELVDQLGNRRGTIAID